ncbi:hypothetical protein SAMN04489725_11613 [Alicyclobacillus hesperidum]|uniref:Uncharacterized protein n=1 Tax=Alicyclobacillus hesperidum TaxID=89784 RepID=A0A1H2WNK9_9BACL|nr:hypothetical protein SAMN04489725_11613 [Alicyclobacillus hesperidum]
MMTASDIWNFTSNYVDACAPVILIVAIVSVAGKLIDLITGIFDRGD